MIILGTEVVRTIVSALRASDYIEQCGYLLGRRRSADLHVERFLALPHAGRRGCFSIAETDLDLAVRLAYASALEILALFHSHPSGILEPSKADIRGIRHSRFAWVIAVRCESVAGGLKAIAYEPQSLGRVAVCIC